MGTRKPERLHDPLPGALGWWSAFGFRGLLDYPTPGAWEGFNTQFGGFIGPSLMGFSGVNYLLEVSPFCIFIFGVF